jgi:hypothetical protein
MFAFLPLSQINDALLTEFFHPGSVLIMLKVKGVKLSRIKNIPIQAIQLLLLVAVGVYQQSMPLVKLAPMDQLSSMKAPKNTRTLSEKQPG